MQSEIFIYVKSKSGSVYKKKKSKSGSYEVQTNRFDSFKVNNLL